MILLKRILILSLVIWAVLSLISCVNQNINPPVTPETEKGQGLFNIDDAINEAIKGRSSSYTSGEVVTEGHTILSTKDENGVTKVYTIASCGAFGFENGIFTKISGSGAIPTVITFSQDKEGNYILLEYEEPMDGSGYGDSIRRMFPLSLHSRVLAAHKDYKTLAKQQEAQAKEYLEGIGRDAKVSADYVKKELPNIDVEASNKIFSELAKYDAFLNACPYWLGTRERVEEGLRYIYRTSQSETEDGFDLITFTKEKEDGTVVKEQNFKIIDSEPIRQ